MPYTAQQLANIILQRGEDIIIIDGMSAAGKTTLSLALADILDCDVVHIDDFFLPADKRTADIAGNIDAERFVRQVTDKLGGELVYDKYNCRDGTYGEAENIRAGRVIVEGAYACHESLGLTDGLRVFLECEREEQYRRILERSSDEVSAHRFFDTWIPRETAYFDECNVKDNCHIIISAPSYKIIQK